MWDFMSCVSWEVKCPSVGWVPLQARCYGGSLRGWGCSWGGSANSALPLPPRIVPNHLSLYLHPGQPPEGTPTKR